MVAFYGYKPIAILCGKNNILELCYKQMTPALTLDLVVYQISKTRDEFASGHVCVSLFVIAIVP